MKKEYETPFFELFRLEITDDLLSDSGETNMAQANANFGNGSGDDSGMGEDFF